MSDLLDADVWVALVAADHVHHERALHYWREESAETVACCRVTVLAFLHLITDAHVMQHAVLTGTEAWALLQEWLTLPEGSFLDEPVDLDDQLGQLSRVMSIRPKLWTDAYLAAFATAGGHRIVTLEGDFPRFPGLDLLLLQERPAAVAVRRCDAGAQCAQPGTAAGIALRVGGRQVGAISIPHGIIA